jgi:threonyl-tRNA synthetase
MMVVVTLPDGSKENIAQALTVAQVAQSIGSGIAKAALAGRVNGHLVDLSHTISENAELSNYYGQRS